MGEMRAPEKQFLANNNPRKIYVEAKQNNEIEPEACVLELGVPETGTGRLASIRN